MCQEANIQPHNKFVNKDHRIFGKVHYEIRNWRIAWSMSANIKLWVHLIYGNRFYFRLACSLLIFSHRCMVTQCAQLLLKVDNKDEEIKENKTTARKIGLREEKRKPIAWWRNLCKLFSCASLRQYDNHNGFIKRLKYHFWKLSYCICHFLIKSSYLIELLLDQVTQELMNWINSQLEQSATDNYWTTGG